MNARQGKGKMRKGRTIEAETEEGKGRKKAREKGKEIRQERKKLPGKDEKKSQCWIKGAEKRKRERDRMKMN